LLRGRRRGSRGALKRCRDPASALARARGQTVDDAVEEALEMLVRVADRDVVGKPGGPMFVPVPASQGLRPTGRPRRSICIEDVHRNLLYLSVQ
jgi:hypothetical protein